MQMVFRAPASTWGVSVPDHGPPPWREGFQRSMTAETVSELCQDGQLAEAIEALGVLVHTESHVSKFVFYTVLRQCVGKKDLPLGRRVHALALMQGYESDTFLCNHILRMYASQSRLQEALDVFNMVAKPDAFMWSSIIAAHVKHGRDRQAIQLYHRMRTSSVRPDGHVFVAALQACARAADLKSGEQVHGDVLAGGVVPDLFVCSCLVDMYAKCGRLEDAQKVFDGLPRKDVVTWNAMIAGYSQQGMGQEAIGLYNAMEKESTTAPDSVTFVCLLQACASVGTLALQRGKQFHVQIRERGLQADVVVGGSLVNMYAKCGSLENAQDVFNGLCAKNVVTWNVLIAAYSQQGMGLEALALYRAMQNEGIVSPDSVTFVSLLQACASRGSCALETGKQLHAQISEQGLQADLFVASSLVDMYAKCGSLDEAQGVFDKLGQKDAATWSAMIAGYSQHGMGQQALGLYAAMQEESTVAPSSVTFVCVLQACANVGKLALEKGKQIHAQIRERGLQADVFVTSSLIDMYAKCGSIEDARFVFDGLSEKNVVSWSAMIAGYSQQGMAQEALRLYGSMQEEGMASPNPVTFVCLLQACASEGIHALETGKLLHAQVTERGLQADVFIANSLVNMYAKCGSLKDAQHVFDGLPQKDVVTWNAIIAAYSQKEMGLEALHLLSAMHQEGITAPDSVTFVSVLQACASVGTLALDKGRQLHAEIRERGLQTDEFVCSSLVNMYAKCGSLEDARAVFDGLGKKPVAAWNAMIAGYSQQGLGKEALGLYRAMHAEGMVVPDSVTFKCLLQGCASVAALHLGRQLHAQIKEQLHQVDVLVAGSLIDMYGKCGSMVDAQQVFDALPERDVHVWNSLIAGYTHQGDSDKVFDLIFRMRENEILPDGITFLSILTVCSHTGLVNEGREYFEAMTRHHGITPTLDHYTCMVDLLSRARQLEEALALIRTMPVVPDAAVWHTLLGASQKWNNVVVGHHAFHEAMKLDKNDAAAYVLMSNIYSGAQLWEQAQEIQARRKRIRAWKQPGQTLWTDMDGLVQCFLVRDTKHEGSEALQKHNDERICTSSGPSFAYLFDGKEDHFPGTVPKT